MGARAQSMELLEGVLGRTGDEERLRGGKE